MKAFVASHCAECHDAKTKEGGLDLTSLAFNPSQRENFAVWAKVHNRVEKGEMPPASAEWCGEARQIFPRIYHRL